MVGKNAFKVSLCVNEKNIEFEIDTGSGLTIIFENMHKELFNKAVLLQTNVLLKTYSGEHLQVLGRLPVEIKHHGGVYKNLHIFVVKGNGTTLLGRDLLSKMKIDWYSVNKVDNSLNKLSEQYSSLFSDKLGKMKDFQANIRIKAGATPKFSRARNVPFALQDAVNAELDWLECEGILNSIPYSEWASPIVIVPKPDGRIRICADYKRTVNPSIEAEQYPLLTAEELFNKMKGGKTFSKLDLTSAYLQVELHPESRKSLVVNTIKGLKEFTRMPYGVTPASAIFQKKLENELRPVPKTVVKIDDILISGVDDEDHMKNLTAVFEILSKLGLTLNKSKCRFFQQEVEYLGFFLDKTGIRTNPEKLKAILNAPAPKKPKRASKFFRRCKLLQ